MTIKLRAPKGATSFVHEQRTFEVEDGHIAIPDHFKTVAESLGYGDQVKVANVAKGLPIEVAGIAAALTPEAIAGMDREALSKYVEDNKIELDDEGRITDKRLREIVLMHAKQIAAVIKAAQRG